ncbi:IclR family transcriptional regulator [Acidisoma silvae]|uniref:IclR family transcriptional regulator n=1 Tax=Acidisoma silvae TaxID=2802396 RepID=A0A964E053_9PROT|nr:IclR family transcriptional regulator [Acidisoma silvae]MCB8876797.1 IclR family transcriptional regulator [Acidisoma silvae]
MKSSYSAPALEKGLDILEALSVQAEPLSLTRLAAQLGRSKSEIFRMVMVLLERGYVSRDSDSDTLQLTDRLFTLGLRTPRARDLVSAAMPLMTDLADRTEFSLHLVVLHQGKTVVLGAAPGGRDLVFSLRLGFHRPALDATSGKVVMAFQKPVVRDAIIKEGAPLMPGGFDAAKLADDLARIRRDGFDYHESRHFVGLVDLCCPVLDGRGEAVASILMTCLRRPGEEVSLKDHLPALAEVCAGAARAAGLA